MSQINADQYINDTPHDQRNVENTINNECIN